MPAAHMGAAHPFGITGYPAGSISDAGRDRVLELFRKYAAGSFSYFSSCSDSRLCTSSAIFRTLSFFMILAR